MASRSDQIRSDDDIVVISYLHEGDGRGREPVVRDVHAPVLGLVDALGGRVPRLATHGFVPA